MKHFLHAIKTGLGITPFVTEIKDKKETVNFKGSVQLGKCLCMIVNTSSQDEDYRLYFMCDMINITSTYVSNTSTKC